MIQMEALEHNVKKETDIIKIRSKCIEDYRCLQKIFKDMGLDRWLTG